MLDVIDARFSYEARYREKGGRKFRTEVLNGFQPITIDSLAATDAPVAYRIDPGNLRDTWFDVRSHAGSLWWPLYDDQTPLKVADFLNSARNDWQRANSVLDPLGRTYRGLGQTYDERFAARPVKDFLSNFEEQARQVRAAAARLIFIDGIVHVDAGEPVWFAISNRESRRSFDLVVGPSCLDRKDRQGCCMPCPDRFTRLTAARLGRAFGLSELEKGLAWLGADAIRTNSKALSTNIHRTGPTAVLCATAWAQYLWEVAGRYPDLKSRIQALSGATSDEPPPLTLPYREMLEQFVLIEGTEAARALPTSLSEARLLLERLARADYLDDQDMEAAIETMCI